MSHENDINLPAFKELVDIEQLKDMFESFSAATGFTTGVVDQDSMEIVVATGWRPICTQFHRANSEAVKHCKTSNIVLTSGLNTPGEIRISHCHNGLVDGATPVVIEGKHIATIATGQVMFEEPDLSFFEGLAEKYDFDKEKYFAALKEVPVVSEEKFREVLLFLAKIATTVAQIGYSRLKSLDDYNKLCKIEQELADEHERLNVTLRNVGEGVISTDLDNKIIVMNKAAETLLGVPSSYAIGKTIFDIVILHNDGEKSNYLKKMFQKKGAVSQKYTLNLVNDKSDNLLVVASLTPLYDKDSVQIGSVVVIRDITEETIIEQELFKIKKIESIGVLAGGIAHDFNNILIAIMGNIELAKMKEKKSSETFEILDSALKAGMRAKSLTGQLLTFSKGGDPIKSVASVEELIRESADFILRGSRAVCEYDIPEDLWQVNVDTGQIAQVIQNIILNASQAMPNGGKIRVKCENIHYTADDIIISLPAGIKQNYIKISIIDSGIGISQEDLEKIFDPYFTTKSTGNGLGMAICLSIINKHNGVIRVSSEIGKGSRVEICLPVAENVDCSLKSDLNTLSDGAKGKILLMDDDEMVLAVIDGFLNVLGQDTVLTRDGEEAIEAYRKAFDDGECFDLVFLDITVPGGVGGEIAVKKILEINPNANVVVVSGYSNDPVMANYKDYGFKMAVPKPFTYEDISRVVARYIPSAEN